MTTLWHVSVIYDLVVVAHLLCMAAIVGGYAAVFFGNRAGSGTLAVSELMVWGARFAFVTGLILAGLASGVDSLGKDPDHAKLGVKLVIALAVAATAEIGRGKAKRGTVIEPLTHAAGLLALVNVGVAALWN